MVFLFGYFYLKYPSRVEDAFSLSIENGFADTWSAYLVLGLSFFLSG